MPSPSIVQETESITDPGSYDHVVTLPTSMRIGNLLIMVCGYVCSSATYDSTQWVTPPAGWTYLWGYGFYWCGVCYIGRDIDGTEGETATYVTDGVWPSVTAVFEISGAAHLSDRLPSIGGLSPNHSNIGIPECYDPAVATAANWLLIGAGFGEHTDSADGDFPAEWTLGRHDANVSGYNFFGSCARQVQTADYPTAGTYIISSPHQMSHSIGTTLYVGDWLPPPAPVTGVGLFLEFYDQTTHTWTDISTYVQSWNIEWGAFGPIDQQRARTATFILDNRDRRFEPAYALGAHYPEITVGAYIYCGLNVTSGGATTSYPMFYGTAESWRPSYMGQGTGNAVCTLRACDPTKVLISDLASVTLTPHTSDAMLEHLFNAIEWGGTFTEDFETGVSTLQEYELAGESIWSVAQKIVQSEGGWFFWLPQVEAVTARFLSRTWLALQAQTETVYYFDDDDTYAQYSHIVLGTDDDRLYTRAIMSREGGNEQNHEHAGTSIAVGERTFQESGLLLATDNEVMDRAAHFVETRCRVLYDLYASTITTRVMPGVDATTHMANAVGLTVPLAAINIIHHPPTGASLTFDCRVVGGRISQREPLAPVEITGNLVSADEVGGPAWILQDAVMGVLGTTTVLGW